MDCSRHLQDPLKPSDLWYSTDPCRNQKTTSASRTMFCVEYFPLAAEPSRLSVDHGPYTSLWEYRSMLPRRIHLRCQYGFTGPFVDVSFLHLFLNQVYTNARFLRLLWPRFLPHAAVAHTSSSRSSPLLMPELEILSSWSRSWISLPTMP